MRPKSETRENAERAVDEVFPRNALIKGDRAKLIDAIEVALNAERERAVRLIDEHQALDVCRDNCWTTIKEAIRGKD